MNQIKTPRGTIVRTGSGKAELTWNPGFGSKWTGNYTRAQAFVDSEVLRLSDAKVPMQTGMLKKSGTLGTQIGSGEVCWIAPYARYQYYGRVMVGAPPKTATDIPLDYHNSEAQRGAFWFERMKAESGNAIIAGARRIAGGGT